MEKDDDKGIKGENPCHMSCARKDERREGSDTTSREEATCGCETCPCCCCSGRWREPTDGPVDHGLGVEETAAVSMDGSD